MSVQIKAPHGRDTDAGLKKRHSDSDYNPAPSFSDSTVIPCRPGDKRLVFLDYPDDCVGHEQAWDGPIFIVVGTKARAEVLDQVCNRFGLDPYQVMTALASDAGGQV